jgi:two-component system nitrate/nitrite response regulator NarL
METIYAFTNREHDILICVSTANQRKKIADVLKISIHTVDVHLRNLYKKTSTHSFAELALWSAAYLSSLEKFSQQLITSA